MLEADRRHILTVATPPKPLNLPRHVLRISSTFRESRAGERLPFSENIDAMKLHMRERQ